MSDFMSKREKLILAVQYDGNKTRLQAEELVNGWLSGRNKVHSSWFIEEITLFLIEALQEQIVKLNST